MFLFFSLKVLAFLLAVLVAARYMYPEKDKTDNLLEVQDHKDNKTTTTQIKTKTKDNGKDSFTVKDNTDKRKASSGTSKNTKADFLLKKSQTTTRKRSATFCLGDSNCSFEDLSEKSRESSDIDIEDGVGKKRSLSLLFSQVPKWKKSHSIHDILKTPLKGSGTTASSHSGKEQKVPKVTVTRHESLKDKHSQHSPPLKSVIEGRSSYESCNRSVQECKQIMKESVSFLLHLIKETHQSRVWIRLEFILILFFDIF